MGRRILIADDAPESRLFLKRLLQRGDYDVIEADDGLTALKLLEEPLAPQIAILDWIMPGLNGPEVVQKLRQSKHNSYTYVLLYTAKSDKADVLTASILGRTTTSLSPAMPANCARVSAWAKE